LVSFVYFAPCAVDDLFTTKYETSPDEFGVRQLAAAFGMGIVSTNGSLLPLLEWVSSAQTAACCRFWNGYRQHKRQLAAALQI